MKKKPPSKSAEAPKATAKVIPLRPVKKPRRTKEDKWGKSLDSGFCTVPSLLMRGQKRLGLNPAEFNIVMHLADHWWDANEAPFPAKDRIAKRMNMSARQVQRYLTSLEKKKLIQREARYRGKKWQDSNRYHLDGLVQALIKLASEFKDVEAKTLRARKHVETKK